MWLTHERVTSSHNSVLWCQYDNIKQVGKPISDTFEVADRTTRSRGLKDHWTRRSRASLETYCSSFEASNLRCKRGNFVLDHKEILTPAIRPQM